MQVKMIPSRLGITNRKTLKITCRMWNTSVTLSRQLIVDRYRQRIAASERTRLTKTDLAELIVEFIDRLAITKAKAKIQELCTAEIALLEEGYPQATIGKVYLPMYRKAIQAAVDDGLLPLTKNTSRQYTYSKRHSGEAGVAIDHFALDYLKYDAATYSQFAGISAERNNLKQDNLQPVNPDIFLAIAADLLNSEDPFDLAVGIAATTGRRFSEIVAKGTLTATDDTYWISFAGQLKKSTYKKPVEADSYLTPCLLPAAIVLAAMERFRQHPRIAALADFSAIQINRSLADSVKRSVIRNFGDTGIVPILASESAVTVHNLRGVYGEICTHYFCPPDRAVSRFVQERLGHVISADELKRANSSATQHYFHYYLVDGNGQHLGAKGIKLSGSQQIEIIANFDEDLDLNVAPVQLELLANSITSTNKATNKQSKKESNLLTKPSESFLITENADMNTTTIDRQQFAALQQEVNRLWQHLATINSTGDIAYPLVPPVANEEIAILQNNVTQLTQELTTAHEHIAELERANLGYQQRIEQLMNILQPVGTKPAVVKPAISMPASALPTQRRVPAATKILAAIDTIMLWNSQNTQKFVISQTLLLKATGCNLPAIKRVLSEQAEMIDRHHAKYDIQPRHQSKKIDMILDFMQQR
jgi:integrase